MSKHQRIRRRLPFAGTLGVALGLLVVFGVFAGGAVSAPTAGQEMPTPRSTPSVSGKQQEGETLTANSGQWLYADGLPCSSRPAEACNITWQWQRCNPQATSCGDIGGQRNTSYVLTSGDVGMRVRVVQTLTKNDCDAHGQNCRDVSSSQVSPPTGLIAGKPVVIPAPQNAELPAITGTPMEEETLTASTGLWNGAQPISMTFQWYRCDANGNGCAAIAAANQQTYKLTFADVGFTIRVTGTATNAGGSGFATSQQTPVIAAFGPTAQRRSIGIDRVALPHRLILKRPEFRPARPRAGAPFDVRIQVMDTRGFRIQGARVDLTSVPFGQVGRVTAATTNANGIASFKLFPTQRFPRSGTLYLFVRARKPGENANAGVSTAELFAVRLAVATR